MRLRRLFIPVLAVVCGLGTLSGCATLDYYQQAARGHLEVLAKRRPIAEMLKSTDTPAPLRARLASVLEIREFAARELRLPVDGNYSSYANLGRDYVVWNLFATPEFSFAARQWCFLLVGCLSYRGYYSESAARAEAARLATHGLDVYVGGVIAYSTLGWFDDPILNTMLRFDEVKLAQVIFHELAHQLLFVKDDTDFNEAFADTVALAGVERWLTATGRGAELEHFHSFLRFEDEFLALLARYRERLQLVFDSGQPAETKRIQKQDLYRQLAADYGVLRTRWRDFDVYDGWIRGGLNNAKLAALATYRDLLPGLRALLDAAGSDLAGFHDRAVELARCSRPKRHAILRAKRLDFVCPGGAR